MWIKNNELLNVEVCNALLDLTSMNKETNVALYSYMTFLFTMGQIWWSLLPGTDNTRLLNGAEPTRKTQKDALISSRLSCSMEFH